MRFKKFRKKGMERWNVVKEVASSTQIQDVVMQAHVTVVSKKAPFNYHRAWNWKTRPFIAVEREIDL